LPINSGHDALRLQPEDFDLDMGSPALEISYA